MLTASWSRRLYGPRAMALAAWLFALSPNLSLMGPSRPWNFRSSPPPRRCSSFLAVPGDQPAARSGPPPAVGGLAFSCKFTTCSFRRSWRWSGGSHRWQNAARPPLAARPRGRRGDGRLRARDGGRRPGRHRLRRAASQPVWTGTIPASTRRFGGGSRLVHPGGRDADAAGLGRVRHPGTIRSRAGRATSSASGG